MNWKEAMGQGLEELQREGQRRELFSTKGLSFFHNDYLGLSTHPQIREAGRRALESCGAGSQGSRLLGGNHPLIQSAEEAIAEFFGAPRALFFSTGYLANLAVVTALGKLADNIYSDRLNHASLIDGVRLSHKPRQLVDHGEWDGLTLGMGRNLMLCESLFSMDGDFADYTSLSRLRTQGGFLILDEAHSAGVFGEGGVGYHRLVTGGENPWRDLAVVVTFGKAFGVAGAAVLAESDVCDWILNHGRSFIYTTAPSPVVAAMVEASLPIVRASDDRRQELHRRARWLRDYWQRELPGALPSGNSAMERSSPIIPLRKQGNDEVLKFCQNVREFGFDLRAIRYPTVALGQERIRVSLSLSVDAQTTERMAQTVVKLWTESL